MRKTADVTQRQLAQKLGREHNMVGRLELGERRLDVVEFRCNRPVVPPQVTAVSHDERSDRSTPTRSRTAPAGCCRRSGRSPRRREVKRSARLFGDAGGSRAWLRNSARPSSRLPPCRASKSQRRKRHSRTNAHRAIIAQQRNLVQANWPYGRYQAFASSR